jgi:hypothetical protein
VAGRESCGIREGPFVRMDERVDYGPPLTCLHRWLPAKVEHHTVTSLDRETGQKKLLPRKDGGKTGEGDHEE